MFWDMQSAFVTEQNTTTDRIPINERKKSEKLHQAVLGLVVAEYLIRTQKVIKATTLLLYWSTSMFNEYTTVTHSSGSIQDNPRTRPFTRSQRVWKCKLSESLSNPLILYQELRIPGKIFYFSQQYLWQFLLPQIQATTTNIWGAYRDVAALLLNLTTVQLPAVPHTCCPMAPAEDTPEVVYIWHEAGSFLVSVKFPLVCYW